MKREVDRRAKAYIAPRLDDHRAPPPRFARAHQRLSAIVHHHHFEVAPRLLSQGVQTLQQSPVRRQSGDYHGNCRLRQCSILARPEIFVPLEIGRGRADTGDIQASVAIQVRYGAHRRREDGV